MRPAELATDTATTLDAILHALNTLKERGMDFDLLVLLQPTQPLRTADDIDRSIELCVSEGCLPLVSVSEVDDHPLLIRTISGNRLSKMLDVSSTCRRQDMPAYYRVNGCIYINRIDEVDETTSFNDNILPFVMERSHSVDIDELRDLAVAEYYLKERK
jgi:CMP-N-acetylneuraminic acid synthetase